MSALDDIKSGQQDGKNPRWVKKRARAIMKEKGIKYTQALREVEKQIEADLDEQFGTEYE